MAKRHLPIVFFSTKKAYACRKDLRQMKKSDNWYLKKNSFGRHETDASLNRKWDELSIRNTAIEEGVLIGMEKERARHEREKISTAMYLKKMGISVEDISGAVGLGVEDIERL